MTIEEALKEIESTTFDTICMLASGTRTFIRIVETQTPGKWLKEELHNPDVLYHVVRRVIELALAPSDPRFEHVSDTPVAAYLWLISTVDLVLAWALYQRLICFSHLSGRRFFWARHVADHDFYQHP